MDSLRTVSTGGKDEAPATRQAALAGRGSPQKRPRGVSRETQDDFWLYSFSRLTSVNVSETH